MSRVDRDAGCGQVFARIHGNLVGGIEGAPSSIEESEELVEMEVAIVLDLEDMGDIMAFK